MNCRYDTTTLESKVKITRKKNIIKGLVVVSVSVSEASQSIHMCAVNCHLQATGKSDFVSIDAEK